MHSFRNLARQCFDANRLDWRRSLIRMMQQQHQQPRKQGVGNGPPNPQNKILAKRQRNVNYVPGSVRLQVLGTGAPGSPASVYLFSDQARYLFNCGEGTQRLAHEHKLKLTRLEHVFLTRNDWTMIGGIPGLCLTVQEAGVPKLTIHAPAELNGFFGAMNEFVILRYLEVVAEPCKHKAFYDDPTLSVTYICLDKNSNQKQNTKTSTTDETHVNGNGCQWRQESKTNDRILSFICKLKPKLGALSIEKCLEKGVTPGPLLGQLKKGLDITLPDGRIVLANDVCEPETPGPIFIVLDIPSEEYLDSLQKQQTEFTANAPTIILHFTPHRVMQTPIYKDFMKQFPSTTDHLLINDTNNFSGYLSAHRIQYQLNSLLPNIFPILNENQENDSKPIVESGCELNGVKQMCVSVCPLSTYELRPECGLNRANELILKPELYVQEIEHIPGLVDYKEEHSKLTKVSYQQNEYAEYPKIVFLGTGSCIPNKTRNVSAILLHTDQDSCILLDCGEGTIGQLLRFYGVDMMPEIMKKLKAIYISHLHADHHLGLIGILKLRKSLLEESRKPINLFAPEQIKSWLYFYDENFDSMLGEFDLKSNSEMLNQPLDGRVANEMGLQTMSTCLVRHCPHAFGVSFGLTEKSKSMEPIKITYSGDTMPCQDLVELGMNSTVLIHEATMEDDLAAEALVKRHSTMSQAIDQGTKMNATFVLLTHFSQRYAKIPRLEANIVDNIGLAFDNMQLTLNDLSCIPQMNPAYKLLFEEHCIEMEKKSMKRARKKMLE